MSRVLIVEDSLSDLELIMAAVREHYETTWSPTLADAITQLTRNPPDAVLLDVHLPDSNESHHTVSEVKKHRNNAAIVVVSGDDDPRTIEQGLSDNADGWVVKGANMAKAVLYELQKGIANHRKCCKVDEGIKHLYEI